MKLRVKGQAALYLAATILALVSLCVKLASRYYSPLFVSASRFLLGAVFCVVTLSLGFPGTKPKRIGAVILRGFFGSLAMITSYAAVSLTGPGRATLLANTYPLFVAFFGALLFGEKVGARTFASALVCAGGAFLVVRDGSGAALSGDLLALASAVFSGFAVNFVRRASAAGENPFVLYLSPCLFGLPLLAFAPGPGPLIHSGAAGLLLLFAVGFGGFAAQAILSYGYRTVPASRGSVVFYWETALTVLLGLLFGGERLNLRFALGLAAIVGGLWLNRPSVAAGGASPAAPIGAEAAAPGSAAQAAPGSAVAAGRAAATPAGENPLAPPDGKR